MIERAPSLEQFAYLQVLKFTLQLLGFSHGLIPIKKEVGAWHVHKDMSNPGRRRQ